MIWCPYITHQVIFIVSKHWRCIGVFHCARLSVTLRIIPSVGHNLNLQVFRWCKLVVVFLVLFQLLQPKKWFFFFVIVKSHFTAVKSVNSSFLWLTSDSSQSLFQRFLLHLILPNIMLGVITGFLRYEYIFCGFTKMQIGLIHLIPVECKRRLFKNRC